MLVEERMKRIIALVLCLVLALSIVGCGNKMKYSDSSIAEVNAFPNVSLELYDDTITNGLLTLTLTNNNDFDIESGNQYDFGIEVLHKDKWQSIEIGERDNTADACSYYTGKHLIQFGISEIYGELPSGHYRLVKCFWPENGGLENKFYLSAEFDVE